MLEIKIEIKQTTVEELEACGSSYSNLLKKLHKNICWTVFNKWQEDALYESIWDIKSYITMQCDVGLQKQAERHANDKSGKIFYFVPTYVEDENDDFISEF